jgi:protein-S-isoprenylcysteine O-methyltransferase Ste14
MIVMGMRRFQAAGTNIPPTLPTTALVVDGPYRRTRNPLYLGMTLVYLGLGVAAGSLWAIRLVVPLLWVMNTAVIAREEHYLERKFGDSVMRIAPTRRGYGGGFDGDESCNRGLAPASVSWPT